jgi:CheY-like chemotaxis protein
MTARILVVDDEPDLEALIQQKFRHQVRDGAVRFLFASDGVEALAVLKANRDVDMVVTDINMPRMTGCYSSRNCRRTKNSSRPSSSPPTARFDMHRLASVPSLRSSIEGM